MAEVLSAYPGTDALFCSSDMLALGVLIEAQARGLTVAGNWALWDWATWSLPPACSRRCRLCASLARGSGALPRSTWSTALKVAS